MADFRNANGVIGVQHTLVVFSMTWWALSLTKPCKQWRIGWASIASEPSHEWHDRDSDGPCKKTNCSPRYWLKTSVCAPPSGSLAVTVDTTVVFSAIDTAAVLAPPLLVMLGGLV